MLRISREQQPANGADPTGDIVEHCVPKLGNNGGLIYLVDEVFSDQRHGPPHDHNHVCALARSLRSPSSRQSYRVLTATSQASLPFLGSPRLRQQTGRLSARLKRRFQRSAGLLANATDSSTRKKHRQILKIVSHLGVACTGPTAKYVS